MERQTSLRRFSRVMSDFLAQLHWKRKVISVPLAICIFFPAAALFCIEQPIRMDHGMACVGLVLACMWVFVQKNREEIPAPRSRKLSRCFLGAILTVCVVGVLTALAVANYQIVSIMSVLLVLRLLGLAAAVLGMMGVVKGLTEDRRWLAIYVIAFTFILLCAMVIGLCSSMDLPYTMAEWQGWAVQMILLGLSGLVAAAWSFV